MGQQWSLSSSVENMKLVYAYFDRLEALDCKDDNCLVRIALKEHRNLNLNWFCKLDNGIRDLLAQQAEKASLYPSQY